MPRRWAAGYLGWVRAAAAATGKKGMQFNSVSRRFINDLNALMDDLNSTKAHFIRCMKPNSQLKASLFGPSLVLQQLQHVQTHRILQVPIHRGIFMHNTGVVGGGKSLEEKKSGLFIMYKNKYPEPIFVY